MRSASRAGSVFASHNPQAGPMTALVTRKTHAEGQSSVPAVANSKAPSGTTKKVFCSSSFAIMRRVPFPRGGMIARFFGKLAALVSSRLGRQPLRQLVDPRSLSGRQGSDQRRLRRAGAVGGSAVLHVGGLVGSLEHGDFRRF